MNRRVIAYILSVLMCVGITGCGNFAEESRESQAMSEQAVASSEEKATMEAAESMEESMEEQESKEVLPFSDDFYEYDSMAEMLLEYGIQFGTVVGADIEENYTLQGLIGQHFNSVTAGNEMKAYSLLDAGACRKAADGMPVMNFSGSDAIIQTAKDNGVRVRGHVLVWDAYMSNWFFREGYRDDGDYVDRETMKRRLESYITQVINYYEENYPGVVYCWDVVNEAVGDGSADYEADDSRHVRVLRNGEENPFYTVIGQDYVELSFLYARNAVENLKKENPDVDIKLFYNDYSTFYSDKRDAICSLVESINSYASDADGNPRKLCDGVGMQGYIGGYGKQSGCMNMDDINKIITAINKFASLGVEVQITEMSVRNYSDAQEDIDKHAKFYQKLMKALVEVNSGEEKPLTGISIWGLTDMEQVDKNSYGYKMNGPYSGLFTAGYYAKEAFYNVYVALKEMGELAE